MNNSTYVIFGTLLVAGTIWMRTTDWYKAASVPEAAINEQSQTVEIPFHDEGEGWVCSRSNANGSGTVPCILITEPNRVTFSFTDSAQITFHTQNRQGKTAEVSGVQVEGSNREPAFGFCDFTNGGARCRVSNGPEMVEYEAR